MTLEERACSIVDNFNGQTFSDSTEAEIWLRRRIEEALRAEIDEIGAAYMRRLGDDLWSIIPYKAV